MCQDHDRMMNEQREQASVQNTEVIKTPTVEPTYVVEVSETPAHDPCEELVNQ